MTSISWGTWDDKADACLTTSRGEGNALWLKEIGSPLTMAMSRGIALPAILDENPEAGNVQLDQLVNEIAEQMHDAIADGVDGVAYRLDGAYPAVSTPMQYGGYFLERDRELLEILKGLKFNLVFVEGTDEVYLDTVSDLPAHAFGWRMQETGYTPEMMSLNRPGPYASFDELGEIRLKTTQEICA